MGASSVFLQTMHKSPFPTLPMHMSTPRETQAQSQRGHFRNPCQHVAESV